MKRPIGRVFVRKARANYLKLAAPERDAVRHTRRRSGRVSDAYPDAGPDADTNYHSPRSDPDAAANTAANAEDDNYAIKSSLVRSEA